MGGGLCIVRWNRLRIISFQEWDGGLGWARWIWVSTLSNSWWITYGDTEYNANHVRNGWKVRMIRWVLFQDVDSCINLLWNHSMYSTSKHEMHLTWEARDRESIHHPNNTYYWAYSEGIGICGNRLDDMHVHTGPAKIWWISIIRIQSVLCTNFYFCFERITYTIWWRSMYNEMELDMNHSWIWWRTMYSEMESCINWVDEGVQDWRSTYSQWRFSKTQIKK